MYNLCWLLHYYGVEAHKVRILFCITHMCLCVAAVLILLAAASLHCELLNYLVNIMQKSVSVVYFICF